MSGLLELEKFPHDVMLDVHTTRC